MGKKTSNEKDVIRVCVNCGEKFTFTGGEQQSYKSKGFKTPKRCKKCRNHKFNPKKLVTVPGAQKVNKHHFPMQSAERINRIADSNKGSAGASIGKKCGECAIGGTDKCPNPVHKRDNSACDLFVSKEILTEEMIDNFPKQGKASRIKFGREGQSQFKRSKRESG